MSLKFTEVFMSTHHKSLYSTVVLYNESYTCGNIQKYWIHDFTERTVSENRIDKQIKQRPLA